MRFALLTVLIASMTGCGPLVSPMAPRLEPEMQRQVDQAWDNLLTPVRRVDRQTLLDANIAFWMYTMGVDRLHMVSQKCFSGGTAIMEIDCDRANADSDQYTITVLDRQGRTVRRERYSRSDVEESSKMLVTGDVVHAEPTTQPTTQSATAPSETPEHRRLREEIEHRRAAVIAATQPARLRTPADRE